MKRNFFAAAIALCVVFASCQAKSADLPIGRFEHSQPGYTMEIRISDGKLFEIVENGEPQVKGRYSFPAKGGGVFEITDVCFDGTEWFSFEEMREITNWDREVPFAYDGKAMTFNLSGMPSIKLLYQGK